MKTKKIGRVLLKTLGLLLAALLLFTLGTYISHRSKTAREIAVLKEKGYYHPVSVGKYSLNISKFGNEEGKHTFVGLAGLGSGDFSVSARQMTAELEKDGLVVFVDRAGYGFSEDTEQEMTLEAIVEDYRKALKNDGIKPPYILLPHSIGGAYANYWVSHYPEEIEAVVFVDGSQLSDDAFEDELSSAVTLWDRILSLLARLGFSRYVLRDYYYHLPDNYSEEEQYLGDALSLMTMDSIAPVSESVLLAQNAQEAFHGIVTNDVPKLYICASWGIRTNEELIEHKQWINRQIEINDMDREPYSLESDNEILALCEGLRNDIIYPYAEKMGNCEVVCLGGDHMIFEQKPEQCGKLIRDFIDGLT